MLTSTVPRPGDRGPHPLRDVRGDGDVSPLQHQTLPHQSDGPGRRGRRGQRRSPGQSSCVRMLLSGLLCIRSWVLVVFSVQSLQSVY